MTRGDTPPERPPREPGPGDTRIRWLTVAAVLLYVATRLPLLLRVTPFWHGIDEAELLVAWPLQAALEADGPVDGLRAFFTQHDAVTPGRDHVRVSMLVESILFVPFGLLFGADFFALKVQALATSAAAVGVGTHWLGRTFGWQAGLAFALLESGAAAFRLKWSLLVWPGSTSTGLLVLLLLSVATRAVSAPESFRKHAAVLGVLSGFALAYSYAAVGAVVAIGAVVAFVPELRRERTSLLRGAAGFGVGLFPLAWIAFSSRWSFSADGGSLAASVGPARFIENLFGPSGVLALGNVQGTTILGPATGATAAGLREGLGPFPALLFHAAAALLVLGAFVRARTERGAEARTLSLVLATIAAFSLIAAASARWNWVANQGRYLLPVLPAWVACLAIASGAMLRHRWTAAVGVVVLGLAVAPGIHDQLRLLEARPAPAPTDWKAARYLRLGLANVGTGEARAVNAALDAHGRDAAWLRGFRVGFSGGPLATAWPFPGLVSTDIGPEVVGRNLATLTAGADDKAWEGAACAIRAKCDDDPARLSAFFDALGEPWRETLGHRCASDTTTPGQHVGE